MLFNATSLALHYNASSCSSYLYLALAKLQQYHNTMNYSRYGYTIGPMSGGAPPTRQEYGFEMLGQYISVYWPREDEYNIARIANYNKSHGTHLVIYTEPENPTVESINMNDDSCEWHIIEDPAENYPGNTPLGMIGRLILIDGKDDDTREERMSKVAIVLFVVKLPDLRSIGPLHGFTGVSKAQLMHKIMFLSDNHLIDIDLTMHSILMLKRSNQ
eukprot:IDg13438t1